MNGNFNWKLAASRWAKGAVTGLVGALSSGMTEPKQIAMAVAIGTLTAVGVDLDAWERANRPAEGA
jgi:hypothetical protein